MPAGRFLLAPLRVASLQGPVYSSHPPGRKIDYLRCNSLHEGFSENDPCEKKNKKQNVVTGRKCPSTDYGARKLCCV
jgi:hypothetical protein